jgi:DNA-binding FrmR family transcriptional regulator
MAAYAYLDHKEDVLARLKKVEGQVRGLSRMVEIDAYCIDILTQITAASNALKKVAIALLDDHIRYCMSNATTESPKDMVGEATAAIERLVKS